MHYSMYCWLLIQLIDFECMQISWNKVIRTEIIGDKEEKKVDGQMNE